MRPTARSDPKGEVLRAQTTLNPPPEQVTDPLFQTQPFCDARDLVQVKYEMLHRVMIEGQPVGATAAACGFSRVTLYHLRQRFEAAGLAGLLPQPKGPRRAHKLSDDVVAFVLRLLEAEPDSRMAAVPQRVAQQFGISVHLRRIERALARQRKKERAVVRRRASPCPPSWGRGPRQRVATNPCATKPWSFRVSLGAIVWKWILSSGKVWRRGWHGSRKAPLTAPSP